MRDDSRSIERGAEELDRLIAPAETVEMAEGQPATPTATTAAVAATGPLSEVEAERLVDLVATWPRLRYEREREDIAKTLGVRVGQLDKLVSAARCEAAGAALPFDEVEPWGEAVNGAELLADLAAIIRRFVVLDREQATVCALWVVLSYLADRATVLPILALSSPEKGCGKTTALGVVGRLADRSILASNISPAALYRTVEKWMPTLLIDEADSFLRDNDELRGILNSGHTRDSAYVIRTVGDDFEPRRFSTWGPKAIALIGRLPDTLEARAINITMRRKAAGERTANLRHADRTQFDQLRSRIARWATDNDAAFAAARPALPESLENRAGDNAEPVIALADLAGDKWPELARDAVVRLLTGESESPSIGEELLASIKGAFERNGVDRISTVGLLETLNADEEARWATYDRGKPMTARQLAKRLTAFGIKPKVVRINYQTPRGYEWSQFADTFARYLPSQSATVSQPAPLLDSSVAPEERASATSATTQQPVRHAPTHVVADRCATKKPAATLNAVPVLDRDNVADVAPLPHEDAPSDRELYRRASRGE